MVDKARLWRPLGGAFLALLAGLAGAGGHLDVDDAGTLDPGQCAYEAWSGRTGAERVRVWHLGPACRFGPFEASVNLDRYSEAGAVSHVLGPQLKSVLFGNADAPWSAALSGTWLIDVSSGARRGGQLLLPVTWHPAPSLWVHGNAGSDWLVHDGSRTARYGLGAEWALTAQLSLLAERSKAYETMTTRWGVRGSLTPLISIDLTASRTGPQAVRGFVLGLNHEFSRP